MPNDVVILPAQASRIAQETAKTGAAIGVSQSGSNLTLDIGKETFAINAGGFNIPSSEQERMC